ncbi:unnamed protein product [Paramecium sonneborni]|uniref:Calcineurin-like phosphoesterase domain-containing protein n=1 Tax=Paramecium sonneborni TaxID=65129 RepID=A0A8S1M7A1_9CILI|nr:unnamed protein product [Paramecium sonneborni]
MQNNQKLILCASDLHLNFETVQQLIEREKNQKFDAVFLLGDFLNLQHTQGEDSNLDNLRKLLNPFKSFGCQIYLIPGNHDSNELLEDNFMEEGFTNVHKKSLQIGEDLWIVGLGGSIPGFNKQGLIWQGYPYKSDEEYQQDLEKLNVPEVGNIILMTHIGPSESQTTISSENGWDNLIRSGSDSLSNFIKKKLNIILNVHGHTHDGVGSRMVNQCKVVNVGPLLYGNYSIIRISNKVDKIEHIFI